MTDQAASNAMDASRAREQSKFRDHSATPDELDEYLDPAEPNRLMEEVATFDEVVVWGHDAIPTDEEPAVRGLQEWIGLAEAMHSYDGSETASK
jgi:Ribonuclease H2 non-catalytic subunit (Ylr154p-like)